MKRYLLSTPSTLKNLMDCFSSTDDFLVFLSDWNEAMIQTANFSKLLKNFDGNDEAQSLIVAHLLLEISVFSRRNMDTIKDLVNATDYEYVDENKKNEQMQSNKLIHLEDLLKLTEPDVKD